MCGNRQGGRALPRVAVRHLHTPAHGEVERDLLCTEGPIPRRPTAPSPPPVACATGHQGGRGEVLPEGLSPSFPSSQPDDPWLGIEMLTREIPLDTRPNSNLHLFKIKRLALPPTPRRHRRFFL